jgi:predicted small integral membrane protein
MIRITKIAAALFIGAIGLLFFLDNLFNLESAYSAVSFVVSGAEQPYYKILGPTVSSTWHTYLALFTIMAGELAVGAMGFLGAFRMIKERKGSAESFSAAKSNAIAAGVLGMLIWYGFFVVIGEGYFHMWQTEIGLGSVEGAFRYGTVCAVLMFYIATQND